MLLCVVALLFLPGAALAQEATGWLNTPGVTPDEVNEVAREIWCPLCSGVRLDSCELRACEQMKDVIAIKLAEGEDTPAIKDYFLAQYGPQILGEPPREGFNWLAWILPFVALAGGAVFLWRQSLRLVQSKSAALAEDSPAHSTVNPTVDPAVNSELAVTAKAGADTTARRDDYERRLEEELAKYG
jgi:cytochrome c-type biogenesis protein CcmH